MVWPGGCVADLKIFVQRGFARTGLCGGDNDPYSMWVNAYSYERSMREQEWNVTTRRAPVDLPLNVWTPNSWVAPVWNEMLELKCLRKRTQPLQLSMGPSYFGACITFDPVNWAERAAPLPRDDSEGYGLYNFAGVDVIRSEANVSVLLLALYYPDTTARDTALLGSSLGLGLLLLAGCCWWRFGRPRCQKRRRALLDSAAVATSPASEVSPAATTPPPPLPPVPNPLPMTRGDGGGGGRQHHLPAPYPHPEDAAAAAAAATTTTTTTMAAAPPAPPAAPARRAPSWRTLPAEAPSWGPPRAARSRPPPPPPPPPQQLPEGGAEVCEAVPMAEAVAEFGTSYRGAYAEARVLKGAGACAAGEGYEDGEKGRQG